MSDNDVDDVFWAWRDGDLGEIVARVRDDERSAALWDADRLLAAELNAIDDETGVRWVKDSATSQLDAEHNRLYRYWQVRCTRRLTGTAAMARALERP